MTGAPVTGVRPDPARAEQRRDPGVQVLAAGLAKLPVSSHSILFR